MAKNRDTKKPKKEKLPQINLGAAALMGDVSGTDTVQTGKHRKR